MIACPEIATYRAENGVAPADFLAFFVEVVEDPETGKRTACFVPVPGAPMFTGFSHAQAFHAAKSWWEANQAHSETSA